MSIQDKDIEYILKEMNISYADAEKALLKSKGDLNKAIRYLTDKKNSIFRRIFSKILDFFRNILNYRFMLTRKDKILINLPIIMIAIILLFFNVNYINLNSIDFIFMLSIIVISNCKIVIDKENNTSNVSTKIKTIITPKESDDIISTLEVTEDNDYNEVNIEN